MKKRCGGFKGAARRLACCLLPLWLLGLPGCALCIGGAVGASVGYGVAKHADERAPQEISPEARRSAPKFSHP